MPGGPSRHPKRSANLCTGWRRGGLRRRYRGRRFHRAHRGVVVNFLDTQIALVEADEGVAIVPSFGLPACRNRKVVMSQLISPVVTLELSQPPGLEVRI